jgi:integrase
VEIEKVQDILGHSSPTITKLIYVEITRQAQRSTADKLGYLFDA